jgi:hypothetical protein
MSDLVIRRKHELEFVLETVLEGFSSDIQALDDELCSLDPAAAYMARMHLAKIKGTQAYLEKRLKEYQGE